MVEREGSNRRNLRIGIGDAVLATPWVFVAVPGNLVIAALLTQYFGIDKVAYGAIASLPAWSNAVQILMIAWLSRFMTPRDLALGLGWFNVGLWSVLAVVIAFLPTGDARGIATFFFGFFALTSLSQSFVAVGWVSWVNDWVPARVRGAYFGKRNRAISLVTVAFLLLAIGLFEIAGDALWPYQALIGGAVVLRCGSILWQYGIRAKTEAQAGEAADWFGGIRESLRAPGLLVFIVFSAWANFWLGFTGPFVPVYCLEKLALTPSQFTGLVVVGSLSGMVGYAWWGRLVDRLGSIPILAGGMVAWQVQNLLWLVVTKDNAWLLVPMWLWGGFFGVAYLLGSFNLLLKLLPTRTKLAGTSLFVAVTSVTAGLAPVIAGGLLGRYGDAVGVYHVGFAISPVALLVGMLLLRGMREPKRRGGASVPGTFRTLRQLIAVTGPGFLSNLAPLGRKRR
jgi:MFS family permease